MHRITRKAQAYKMSWNNGAKMAVGTKAKMMSEKQPSEDMADIPAFPQTEDITSIALLPSLALDTRHRCYCWWPHQKAKTIGPHHRLLI